MALSPLNTDEAAWGSESPDTQMAKFMIKCQYLVQMDEQVVVERQYQLRFWSPRARSLEKRVGCRRANINPASPRKDQIALAATINESS